MIGMVVTLERPASAALLTAEERAVYEFVAAGWPNVQRFVDSIRVAGRAGVRGAMAAHLERTDEAVRAVYGRWLAMELVAGRVHTLERTYESVLRSMLCINEAMKTALAVTAEADEAEAMVAVTREELRLTTRVDWTDRELQALRQVEEGPV